MSPNPFTLTNNGPGTLTVSGYTFVLNSGSGNGFYVASTTCGAPLGSGGSCTYTLGYSATLGAQNVTFEVLDNASNSPQTVTLTGITSTF